MSINLGLFTTSGPSRLSAIFTALAPDSIFIRPVKAYISIVLESPAPRIAMPSASYSRKEKFWKAVYSASGDVGWT